MDCWIYKGNCLYEAPEGYFGFLYKITANNKIYFGKKQLFFTKKVKLSKKARLQSDNKRKRIDHKKSDSDWLDYFGSCKPLLEWINENKEAYITREIISFHNSKIDLTYREVELLIKENVLFRDDCWNSNIMNKFFKGKIATYGI